MDASSLSGTRDSGILKGKEQEKKGLSAGEQRQGAGQQ